MSAHFPIIPSRASISRTIVPFATPPIDGFFGSSGGLLDNARLTPPILSWENSDGSMPVTVTTPGITSFETPNWIRSARDITTALYVIAMNYCCCADLVDGMKKNAGDSRGGQGNVELIQVIEGEIGDHHTDRFFISEMKEPVK